MFERWLGAQLNEALQYHSAVGLLGPRQVGKTTLALEIAASKNALHLDLESPQDLQKLADPTGYLKQHQDKLVVIDEVQRMPGIFRSLRVLIDERRRQLKHDAQFLVLGSASAELLKQSSESLAGRIAYLELGGLNALETSSCTSRELDALWFRGGFPDSYLAPTEEVSVQWRENFIRTYLERDVVSLGWPIPTVTLRRLWTMLCHQQGTRINHAKLATNLSVSSPTIRRYLDLLIELLLVRRLEAWHRNSKKRLVKSPRLYVRDSGLVHQLLGISHLEGLLGHPVVGKSWEGFVIENLLSVAPTTARSYFYRSQAGAEIDLVIEFSSDELWAIEIKRTTAPKIDKGFHLACHDIAPSQKFLVYTGTESYRTTNDVQTISLSDLVKKIAYRT